MSLTYHDPTVHNLNHVRGNGFRTMYQKGKQKVIDKMGLKHHDEEFPEMETMIQGDSEGAQMVRSVLHQKQYAMSLARSLFLALSSVAAFMIIMTAVPSATLNAIRAAYPRRLPEQLSLEQASQFNTHIDRLYVGTILAGVFGLVWVLVVMVKYLKDTREVNRGYAGRLTVMNSGVLRVLSMLVMYIFVVGVVVSSTVAITCTDHESIASSLLDIKHIPNTKKFKTAVRTYLDEYKVQNEDWDMYAPEVILNYRAGIIIYQNGHLESISREDLMSMATRKLVQLETVTNGASAYVFINAEALANILDSEKDYEFHSDPTGTGSIKVRLHAATENGAAGSNGGGLDISVNILTGISIDDTMNPRSATDGLMKAIYTTENAMILAHAEALSCAKKGDLNPRHIANSLMFITAAHQAQMRQFGAGDSVDLDRMMFAAATCYSHSWQANIMQLVGCAILLIGFIFYSAMFVFRKHVYVTFQGDSEGYTDNVLTGGGLEMGNGAFEQYANGTSFNTSRANP
nr:type 2 membrane protein [Salmonid herpesvirus 1]